MRLAPAALVAVVAVLAHLTALGGSFTFDDHAIVEENPRLVVRSAGELGSLLASNWWGAAAERSGERLFRPLPLATFAAERAVVGAPSAPVSRGINVLLHALASVLALALFARVLADERRALLGALLFAAHPLHSEAVAGVVGRAEELALVCGLAALILHARPRRSWASGAGEAALFLLALGSKESAVAFLPAAAALDLALRAPVPGALASLRARLDLSRLGALAGALALYLALRAWAIGALLPASGARTLGETGLAGRALVALAVARDAFSALLLPLEGTAAHYPFPDTRWPGLAGGLALLGLAAVAAAVLLRGDAPRSRLAASLGVVGFLLALAPVANLIPIGVVFAERLLYAPSAWLALAVGATLGGRGGPGSPGLDRGGTSGRDALRRAGDAAWALALLALGGSSLANDLAWKNDRTLWETTVRRFPGEGRARLALGETLLAQGEPAGAVGNLEAATELFPDTQRLKAKAFVRLGQARLALAARTPPLLPRARLEAARDWDRALALDPRSLDARIARARAALEAGRLEDAGREAREACGGAPESYDAHALLGLVLLQQGSALAAEEELSRAIGLSPAPGEALFNRGEARRALGRDREASLDFLEAARALVARGRREEARRALGGVLPSLPPAERAGIEALLR